MKKFVWALVTVGVVLVAVVVSGPYLTVRGLAQAIESRDTARLDRYVDFPVLRANLRAQLDDYVVRNAGVDLQANVVGAIMLAASKRLTGAAVDTLVTPTGIDAVLQGHVLWKRASNDLESDDAYAAPRPARPLQHATHRFESASRFTATAHTPSGAPVVFVLRRSGLRWKLVDIRLPLDDAPPAGSAVLPFR